MILNQVKFFSETLGMLSSMYVLLPKRTVAEMKSKRAQKYRTLYLLHGHSDDHTAWQRFTSIERYAEGLNLAVVMPAVHLSFYNDMAHGLKYWQFISEEVPALVRDMFPLSSARKHNFVAGLSMGGYGAFKLALTYPDRFAAAASLSGALDIREVVDPNGKRNDKARLEEMRTVFGERGGLPRLPGSHSLYHSFFRFESGPPQTSHELNGWGDEIVHDYLRGLEQRGRLGVLYSNKDYGCEWDYDWRNKRFQREDNTKFAVNIVVYAMTA